MLSKTSRALKDPDATAEYSRYMYDPVGRLTETYNSHQYLAFQYDRLGFLVKEHHSDLNEKRQRIADSMVDIHYQRSTRGQLKKLQLPGREAIDYAYDDFERLQQVLFNGAAITHIQRDEFGRELQRIQGNVVTHTDYDPMGRLARQHAVHRQQKNELINREYQYDPFGNLSSFKDGSWEVRYVYDMVDKLKRTEGDLNEHFVFDPAGNLLGHQKSETGKTTRGNRLQMQGDRKFGYDARGNLIREARGKGGKLETVYEYNFNNQLVKVVKEGQTTEYTYDPIGRRIRKQDRFGATHYLWAGDQLAQEQRNNLKKTYIYEPESFKPLAMVQDGEIYHYHLDHLGTPRELTSETGKLVWKARYKTYGNVAEKDVEEVENNLRFQGQYFDEETGLHYNRHRYYDPSVGQFTTQDPIGLLGGVNNYQYAPNPVGWVDPLGLTCKENSWNEFQKSTKDQFSNSAEAADIYHKNKLARAGTPKGSVSEEAQNWQGTGAYYGVDSYKDMILKKGTIIFGGAPGQTNYYTPQATLDSHGNDSKAIFQALQVGSYKGTYRPGMTAYEVKEDIVVAQGTTLANPQFGGGGAEQYYIKENDYKNKLEPKHTLILTNTKA